MTHVYGVAGVVAGLIGLGLAWGVKSPWSEYALMASGWAAAALYAVLIWKLAKAGDQNAKDYGRVCEQVAHLQREIQRLKADHAEAMEQRAKAMEFLAGISMGQQPIPRAQSVKEKRENA